jgi:toxin-antitoxin system PIN domain toxin
LIALDANILVYAHRKDSEWNEVASDVVTKLAEGSQSWAIPWPCIHEFLSIVTSPKIYKPSSTLVEAINQVELWMESPTLLLIGEGEGYWREFSAVSIAGRVTGGAVHDARIAAICCAHGVKELWTVDRDFGRFPKQKVKNPLV